MTPRQARRERREAERKAAKREFKRSRLADNHPLAAVLPQPQLNLELPEIQPRWNPELEDEFPREVQIRNNAIADRIALKAGLSIPPPGPTPGPFASLEQMREHYLSRKKAAQANGQTVHPTSAAKPPDRESDDGFVSQNTSARAEINRSNAQRSTGPRTVTGKSASSRNSTKHGLASGQLIMPGENLAEFEALLADFENEHRPVNTTEELLVKQMAQSHWLSQRAIRLQNDCFTEDGVNEKSLALYLRYFTTHNRAFYKALAELQRLRKERRKLEPGFVSQTTMRATAEEHLVPQNDTALEFSTGFVSQTETPAHGKQRQSASEAA